jgi:hypothetical protein
MRIFGVNEAHYYCSSFNSSTGDAEQAIEDFRKNRLSNRRIIKEGTPLFQQYKDCSLRDVERSLFFAASHYRRSLDLMITSSSPWAQVTLYYGSWYASRALLGMFGCTIFKNSKVIDVDRGSPGQQELHLRTESTTYRGPHRTYWDLFYRAVRTLRPMVDPGFSAALSPVSSNPIWQIEKRNDVNYCSLASLNLAQQFKTSFSKQAFPACLPGVLGTQYGILEGLLELAFDYAAQFGLNTDALIGLSTKTSLRKIVGDLVYSKKPPGLVKKTRKAALV